MTLKNIFITELEHLHELNNKIVGSGNKLVESVDDISEYMCTRGEETTKYLLTQGVMIENLLFQNNNIKKSYKKIIHNTAAKIITADTDINNIIEFNNLALTYFVKGVDEAIAKYSNIRN